MNALAPPRALQTNAWLDILLVLNRVNASRVLLAISPIKPARSRVPLVRRECFLVTVVLNHVCSVRRSTSVLWEPQLPRPVPMGK